MQEVRDLVSLHISLSCPCLYDHRHRYLLSWSFNKDKLGNLVLMGNYQTALSSQAGGPKGQAGNQATRNVNVKGKITCLSFVQSS